MTMTVKLNILSICPNRVGYCLQFVSNGLFSEGLRYIFALSRTYRQVSRVIFTIIFLVSTATVACHAQQFAVKTNVLYDALGVPQLGVEYSLAEQHSVSLSGTYNPLKYGEKKWKNFSLQPEYRYWFHRVYTGPYVGANIVWGGFNIDKLNIGSLEGKQRQGHFVGAGAVAGYNVILSTHFSLDFTVGLDYVHAKYDVYRDGPNSFYEGEHTGDHILPLGTGISVAYIF